MRDNGLLSVGIKLMGVEGPKLLDDERHTQDFTGLSSPTFTTPDVIENVKLQKRLRQGLPGFYFLDPRDSHYLDAIMQGLYSRAQQQPAGGDLLEHLPYLMGEGQAMRFSRAPALRRAHAGAQGPRRRTTCATRWRGRWPSERWSSTSASSSRPTRIGCRSRARR